MYNMYIYIIRFASFSLYLIKSFSIYTCGFVWLSVFEILVDKSLIYKQMRPLPFLLRAKFVCKLNYHLAGWLTVCLSVYPGVCVGVCVSVSEWVCVCVRECICCVGGRRVIHHQAAPAPHRSSRSKRCSSVKHKQLKRMLVNYSKTVMLPL